MMGQGKTGQAASTDVVYDQGSVEQSREGTGTGMGMGMGKGTG